MMSLKSKLANVLRAGVKKHLSFGADKCGSLGQLNSLLNNLKVIISSIHITA